MLPLDPVGVDEDGDPCAICELSGFVVGGSVVADGVGLGDSVVGVDVGVAVADGVAVCVAFFVGFGFGLADVVIVIVRVGVTEDVGLFVDPLVTRIDPLPAVPDPPFPS